MTKTPIAIAVTVLTGLSFVAPVYALNVGGRVEDALEARAGIKAERQDKEGSRPGLLNKFFNLKGRAAIGTGKLTVKTDVTLTVEKDGKSFIVNVDNKTQFRRRFWGKSSLAEMSVGDTINVIGLWADDAHTTINATLVRDVSIQKRFGVFFGEVKSLLSSGWVMTTVSGKRADQTVTVDNQTKFTNRKGETITQADVKVGQKVRVRGLWNSNDNTVTEVTEVKDFALPVRVSVTATTE
ncbi:MAG: hypothetical protein AAB937_01070 [Patescibacteria group bacterium]